MKTLNPSGYFLRVTSKPNGSHLHEVIDRDSGRVIDSRLSKTKTYGAALVVRNSIRWQLRKDRADMPWLLENAPARAIEVKARISQYEEMEAGGDVLPAHVYSYNRDAKLANSQVKEWHTCAQIALPESPPFSNPDALMGHMLCKPTR